MDLSEIRVNIDRVDGEIRKLFIERMGYSDKVAAAKAKTADKIYQPAREVDIIKRNSEKMTPELVKEYQSLIKRIMDLSRKYQYGRMLELGASFPFSYGTESISIAKAVILEEDKVDQLPFEVGEMITAKSYEEIAALIENDMADAGIAYMEEVASGVNNAFHDMMTEHGFYINDCVIVGDEVPKKCVMFSKHLFVLPEHNRLKLMFVCQNRSGGLSSVLSMISDYGVNITEVHSKPFKEEKDWNYEFYLELSGNVDTKEIRTLLFQLSEETSVFKLLGSYHCEGDFS